MEDHKAQENIKSKEDMPSVLSLTKSAGRGAFFQVFGGGTQTIIRIGASIILARLLVPEDFGLFGMALLLGEMILRIGALGMGIGIIAKSDVNDEDLSTAFWTMAVVRCLMFVAAFTLAPFLSKFFEEPRVTNIIRAVSFTFLFQIVGVVGNALLRKRLFFHKIFVINASSALIEAIIAILLVTLYIQNYWALVIAMVSASLWNNMLVFILSRWIPKFRFSKKSFRFLFRYGINSLGASLAGYFNENIDYLLVGKMLGPRMLGFYEFAYRIPFLIENRISSPLKEIMFPTLVHVKNSDEKLARGFVKGVKYISFICLPALGGVAVIAELMVRVLWGDKWMPIVLPLQILCLAAVIKSTTNPAHIVFICKDRPDIPFKFNIVATFFTFVAVAIMGYFCGIVGVAYGMLAGSISGIYLIIMAFKKMRAPIMLIMNSLFPIITSTMMTMLSAYLTRKFLYSVEMPLWVTLILSIFAGAGAYLFTLWFGFKDTRKDMIETFSTILGIKKVPSPAYQ